MAHKKITTRWLTGSLGVIVIILIVVEIIFGFGVRVFYYNSVRQLLSSQVNTVATLLEKYSEDTSIDYKKEVRNLIENFTMRDKMELMALDSDGNITTTSSGFKIAERPYMPDFDLALDSPEARGEYNGKAANENIMAISIISPISDENLKAVRLVVSLSAVDNSILTIVSAAVAFGVLIVFFMVLSGSYFINSIVIPVGEIGKIAGRIAKGDFKTRLTIKNDDEIGELCETINYMAEELQNSETLKNDFISSVSHELRTPLTAIRGWSETILENPEDEDSLKKGMNIIISESDRLASMVEELLDFSRI
ncbi:MAG: histidine kinase dimerization/phospho-acceptor domain-containing protein [Oscillospiraceae bacterium]